MKTITFGGNPITLIGEQVKPGDKALEFTALDNSLKPVKLSDFKGKIKLLSIFPSIDTSVCSVQNHKFNELASGFGSKVVFIAISNDLPFALQRFCGAEGIGNLVTLSDHRDLEFGTNYGFLIKELRLLARGVIVIDRNDVIQYVEYVPEIAQEPNYDGAIKALNELV